MLSFIVLLVIITVLILNSLVKIDSNTVAVPTIGGKRSKKTLAEGWNLIYPLFQKVEREHRYSTKLQTTPVSLSFFSSGDDEIDGERASLEIVADCTMRWQVDPEIENEDGVLRFSDIAPDEPWKKLSSDALIDALVGKIQSELGRFGGLYIYNIFIGDRRPVENYINSILRLRIPPHVNPRVVLERELLDPEYAYLPGKLHELGSTIDSPEIPKEKRIDFYDLFSGPIGDLLRKEQELDERSDVELLLGINLVELTLDKVGFSEESKRAIEKEAQARAEKEASSVTSEAVQAIARKLVEESKGDLSYKDALDSAELVLGLSEKKNISLQGIPDNLRSIIGR